MLMLRGPLKLDLLFLGRVNEPRPPWTLSADTLPGIDDHFWDWALWLYSKELPGDREELVREQRGLMFEYLLGPLGAPHPPRDAQDAVALYTEARERAQAELGVRIDRALGDEVIRALR
jgi:hypothetical protein